MVSTFMRPCQRRWSATADWRMLEPLARCSGRSRAGFVLQGHDSLLVSGGSVAGVVSAVGCEGQAVDAVRDRRERGAEGGRGPRRRPGRAPTSAASGAVERDADSRARSHTDTTRSGDEVSAS